MQTKLALYTPLIALAATACGDDDFSGNGNGNGTSRFTLTLENVSGRTALPGPISPGVWAVHDDSGRLFELGVPDAGLGLEAIAEDGMPGVLAGSIDGLDGILASAAFTTPDTADSAGPAFPGDTYTLEFEASDPGALLSVATMLVQTNDVFLAPDPAGIELFDSSGEPVEGDVTSAFEAWDAGTEANEAPGIGPNQAPRQSGPDVGRAEGVVGRFESSTRSLPIAPAIAEITVEESGGTYTITLRNVGAESGAFVTPIAPIFHVTHDDTFRLFREGMPNERPGLEMLAEDGGPMDLVTSVRGADGVGSAGAQGVTLERPDAEPGPAMPGESFRIEVTPTTEHPYASIAAMVVASNDVFLAFPPAGLALLDESGEPRPAAEVQADARRTLANWDAGTEANEVPGAGRYQPANQPGPDMGPVDPDANVRRYADSTNDLDDAGALFDVIVEPSGDGLDFSVRIENASGDTPFPAILTPTVWAVHDDSASFFTPGEPASMGIERLAEDGTPDALATVMGGVGGVLDSGIEAIPENGTAMGPIPPGDAYAFLVTPDANHPYLSIATMVVPSNDTFLAFGPEGIALLDENGDRRSAEAIASDISASLAAWDAGTEAHQAGAAGPDQAPRQPEPDTGAAEGDGTVRPFTDPVWTVPDVSDVIRATLSVR